MDADPALSELIQRLPTARLAQEAKRQMQTDASTALRLAERQRRRMDEVLAAKFAQHRSPRHLLRNTGSRELIEDSPVHSQLPVPLSGGITV